MKTRIYAAPAVEGLMEVLQICTVMDWFTVNTTHRPNAGPTSTTSVQHWVYVSCLKYDYTLKYISLTDQTYHIPPMTTLSHPLVPKDN